MIIMIITIIMIIIMVIIIIMTISKRLVARTLYGFAASVREYCLT